LKEYIEVGKIINTHGIKGELKILPTTDDAKRFELLSEIYVQTKNGLVTYPIDSVRYVKNFVLLKFQGIEDMTQAERLKTCILKIPKNLALPLEENEYYVDDLYHVKVVTKEGEHLGEIVDILFTAGNDVYVVKDVTNPKSKELLIPAIEDCIISIDVEQKMMVVHLLEGLREV